MKSLTITILLSMSFLVGCEIEEDESSINEDRADNAPSSECEDNEDNNGPNNSVIVLEPLTDCDGTGGVVSGSLFPGQQDWFSYTAEDVLGCLVDPTVSIARGGVEVCMFPECTNSATEFTCPAGTLATSIENNVGTLEGCCSPFAFGNTFKIDDLNCVGADEDVTTFIRVSSLLSDSCTEYTVEYNY